MRTTEATLNLKIDSGCDNELIGEIAYRTTFDKFKTLCRTHMLIEWKNTG